MKGLITHIQRNSIHDGPGIRTTVFMKGCNMQCVWCHNPESINCHSELMFYKNKCIGCDGCKEYLFTLQQNLDEKFDSIGKLPKLPNTDYFKGICFTEALQSSAKEVSIIEVIDKILLDKPFYEKSNGGVTLSGGEPTMQLSFVKKLLKECKKNNLNTAIETNLLSNWKKYQDIIKYIDLFMVDLKIFDDEKHNKYTGASNKSIMKNFYNLDKADIPIIIRTPVIKGINDTVEEITNICKFLKNFKNIYYYELLPYHPLGIPKAKTLRLKEQKQFETPDKFCIENLNSIISDYNLTKK